VGTEKANASIASTVVPGVNRSRWWLTTDCSEFSSAATARGVKKPFSTPRMRSCRGGSIEMTEYLRPSSSGFSGAGPSFDE
jgi:hypothetical protein